MIPRYSCNEWILVYEGSLYNVPEEWIEASKINGKISVTMSGVLNKALKLKNPLEMAATSIKAGQSKDLVLFSRKILNEQLKTDVEIVSSDGTKHRCHKIFLTGNMILLFKH